MLPVLIALPIWLILTNSIQNVVRLCFIILFNGILLLTIFTRYFPTDDMLFNIFIIPGKCPWEGRFPFNILRVFLEIEQHTFIMMLIFIGTLSYYLYTPRRVFSKTSIKAFFD